MEGTYNYEKLAYYPHMKPADVHLWNKFIDEHPDFFETCDYDVSVGEGVIAGDIENDIYARDFQQLTQKKIDVVGYKGRDVWIVEVKPNAGSGAMGQIITYGNLWSQKHPNEKYLHLAIITNQQQSDYKNIYDDQDIDLLTVGFCPECEE